MSTEASPQTHASATGGQAEVELDDRARKPRSKAATWLTTNAAWVLGLDVLLILYFTLASQGHVFWSAGNFQALCLAGTEALILAMGLSMMLGAGQFDLSIGANLVLCSIVAAKIIQSMVGQPDAEGHFARAATPAFVVGFAAAFVTGVAFGLVNGVIIGYLNVNSLIATLGTLGIGTGLAFVIGGGGDIGGLPTGLQTHFTTQLIAGVPAPAVVGLVLMGLVWMVLKYTVFGTNTLAIGSSRTSAARAGIRVRRHIVYLAMFAGACSAVAAFVDVARYASTSINGHNQDGLAALTAVVIGGTLLEGGKVEVIGALWGTVLAVVLLNGLIIVNVPPYYQLVATGVVLILAVAVDQLRSGRRERG
jgi:ribose transport system permease protein